MTALLVFLGGAVGAPSRYLLDRWVQARAVPAFARHRISSLRGRRAPTLADLGFPIGTLVVNLLGCLALGALAGAIAHRHWSAELQALLGTGFCGGLTTFSTFSVEAVELWQGKRSGRAAGYVLASSVIGVGLAAVGYRMT